MDTEAIAQQTYYPGLKINGYLEEQLKRFEIVPPNQAFSPFIPVMSTSIDDLYGEFLSTDATLPIIIAYDTLSRLRPNAFYKQKREQILYTVHGPQDKVFAAIRVINAALDREDSAAQDINQWQSDNSTGTSQDIFFHNVKTFQIDESRDLLELQSALGSTRAIYRNKIIVQYDYHATDPVTSFYT